MNHKNYFLAFLLLLSFKSQFAFAITPAQLPNSIAPGLQGNLLPPTSNNNLENTNLLLSNASPTPTTLPAAAQKITFKLNKLTFTGVTVYQATTLESLYKTYLGKTISLAGLQNIADSITARYRTDGYLLSKAIIPAQKINDGIVTIHVIEGYVSKVVIDGKPGHAKPLLQAYANHLTQEIPITIKTLERYTLLSNDIPGATVKNVLSPAQGADAKPGATQVTLLADEHRANGYITFDNRGTAFIGPLQTSFGGNINSVFRSGDQTSLQGLVTYHTGELQFYRLSHQTPLGSNGLQLNLSANYSRSFPSNAAGIDLATLGIRGTSKAYAVGVSYPWVRTRAENLSTNLTLDTSRSTSDANPGSGNTNLYTDKISSLRLGATYDNADRWQGKNQLGTQFSQGLPILGNSSTDQVDAFGVPTLSRAHGHSVYAKVNLNVSRLQWLGSTNFSVLAAGIGQYAFNPLLVAEQFSFGGSQFGQAYDPAQFTGDHGVSGKLELRYDQNMQWANFNHIQYFSFYDIGKVWNINRGTLVGPSSGASTGFGVRTQFSRYLSGYAQWAQPLTTAAGAYQRNTGRIFFGLTLYGDTSNPDDMSTRVAPSPQAYQPLTTQVPAVAAAVQRGIH